MKRTPFIPGKPEELDIPDPLQSSTGEIPSLKSPLWNRNFFLLWQGQMVSAIGDVFYQVALGFWVLAVTGSTGLMGILMASSTIPRVALAPFMGVLVDRADRKKIMVITDLIRGITVVFIAAAAFAGWLEIWMVFSAGIIIGLCAAFFDPSVASSLPDIVEEKRLMQGNAVFSMIHTVSGILGNSAGGIIYAFLGAPIMFFINGISYLFSSFTELFLKIPRMDHGTVKFSYFEDLKAGFQFIRTSKALTLLFINIGMLNFFLVMGGILYLPYFQQSELFGPAQYGIMMAILTGGSFLGHGFLGIRAVSPKSAFPVFMVSAMAFGFSRTTILLFPSLAVIYSLAFVSGMAVAFINTSIMTTMQRIIPRQHRGKIMGLSSAMGGGLIPLGMALGGVLAEFYPIPLVVGVSGLISFLGFIPLFTSKDFFTFISSDGSTTQES